MSHPSGQVEDPRAASDASRFARDGAETRSPTYNLVRRFRSDFGEELEEVACPLCGSARSEALFEGQDLLYGKPGAYKLVRCAECSLAYVNPRPCFEALGAHYPEDYHCYRPVEASPRWAHPFVRFEFRMEAARRVGAIERAIGRLRPELQVLDVGCGRNAFLHYVHTQRGASCLGVEMHREMVAYVRDQLRMPIVEGTLLDAKLEAGRFDLVTMMEYLEHDLDPLAALSEARRVLKPGGHLAIEIPDFEGPPARFFGPRWVNLDLPRHLVFFEHKTLSQALSRAGFELVSYRRYGRPLYLGFSLLLWLGAEQIMRNWDAVVIFSYLLGLPFLPVFPLLPEFTFAVARAV